MRVEPEYDWKGGVIFLRSRVGGGVPENVHGLHVCASARNASVVECCNIQRFTSCAR